MLNRSRLKSGRESRLPVARGRKLRSLEYAVVFGHLSQWITSQLRVQNGDNSHKSG